MTVFEQDVREKREVARGACRRKGGAGSRKCTLPSDHLTQAQREKRSGPVTVVKLNQPMKWQGYCALPDHLRREYLLHLMQGYRAGQGMLARMLGIGEERMRKELCRLEIALPAPGQYPRGEEREKERGRWERFCSRSGEEAKRSVPPGLETSFEGFPDAAQLNRLYERYRGTRVRVHLQVEVTQDE